MSRNGIDLMQSLSGLSGIMAENELQMGQQSRQYIEYTVKINGRPESSPSPSLVKKSQQNQQKRQPQPSTKQAVGRHEVTPTTTGLDLRRDIYSQEQILDAFNTIDINKDKLLTYEDLSFFLKCMNQPHTSEEIFQMIHLVNNNKDSVNFEEFHKIGKQFIIPIAGIRVPDQKIKKNQFVMENVRNSEILAMDQEVITEIQQNSELDYTRFLQQKQKKPQEKKSIDNWSEQLNKIQFLLKLRTSQQIKQRQCQFFKMKMLNIQEIIKYFKELRCELIDCSQVCQMLAISQAAQVRFLFTFQHKMISAKMVLMEAILNSNRKNIYKLEHIVHMINKKLQITFSEVLHILTFMFGINEKQSFKKKLMALYRHKKLSIQQSQDKHYIIQMLSSQKIAFSL